LENRKDLCVNPFFEPAPDQEKLRFHVFGVPHTPTHSDFSACAFAQKTRFLCWGLKSVGHEVYHYGNELSVDKENPERGVICDEHISVTTEAQLMEAYPNCREDRGVIDYLNPEYPDNVAYLNEMFSLNTAHEVKKRHQAGDNFCYLIPPHALYSRVVSLPVHHVEAGIGYLSKPFLPYKIFDSQGIQAWHYGAFASDWDYYDKLSEEGKKDYPYNPNNHIPAHSTPIFDAIIPCPVNVEDYDFRIKKDDYLLYLGRIHKEKGIDVAMKIAERVGKRLIVAGTGDFEKEFGKPPGHVEVLGPVGVEERRDLISKALSVLTISQYWEPFNIVRIEAMLSGTVPITSDYGGFIDTVRSGYNGYRLNMNQVEEGVWACQNLDKIDPYNLRDFALRFSKEQNALRFNQYFQNLNRVRLHENDLFGIENSDRQDLDWIDFDRKIEWSAEWMQPVDSKEVVNR